MAQAQSRLAVEALATLRHGPQQVNTGGAPTLSTIAPCPSNGDNQSPLDLRKADLPPSRRSHSSRDKLEIAGLVGPTNAGLTQLRLSVGTLS